MYYTIRNLTDSTVNIGNDTFVDDRAVFVPFGSLTTQILHLKDVGVISIFPDPAMTALPAVPGSPSAPSPGTPTPPPTSGGGVRPAPPSSCGCPVVPGIYTNRPPKIRS